MTCPFMVSCQGERSRKGHKFSRQNNYRVRHEKWALPGTSRRCATYSPPGSIFRPRNMGMGHSVTSELYYLIF